MKKFEEDIVIEYSQEVIETERHGGIMYGWLRGLNELAAQHVNHNNGHVLEIGFGLGFFAAECNKIGAASHTIVESHPDIIAKAKEWAEGKDNITIIEGCWQDCIEQINSKQYDGIYFDVYPRSEHSLDFVPEVVDKTLKAGGIFAWYVGGMKDLISEDECEIFEDSAIVNEEAGISFPIKYIKK